MRPSACRRSHLPPAVLTAAAALSIAGCGGSPTPAATAQAHFVALANNLCREFNTPRATGATVHARLKAELAKLRAMESSARRSPPVATYLADTAARRKVLTKLRSESAPLGQAQLLRASQRSPISLMEDAYRLEVKIYADKKALGLTSCLGSPPRKPVAG